MSNLARIQAQRQDFLTAQNSAWLDGLPIIGQSGAGGVVSGSANVGNGALTVTGVDIGAEQGVHVVQVTGIASGFAYLTVTDPDGDVTGQGVVGLPLAAGGIHVSLAQGTIPFAVGDTFAVSVLPVPVDITGLVFTLDSRLSATSASFAFQASSAANPQTIAAGTTGGNIAMRLLQPAMAAQPPGTYPYNILAADPVADPSGLSPVTAFYGLITHAAVLQA
ncbi:hypothetical protein MKK75_27070 [Methylobacterium sp. J-030]|uniref:hypothetical protein n=1 Tax=Methylobacterium sp. J-030 TaxID=2836627 RepID=UPI001FB9DB2D|nr:hypothetical protein [Methylobacterium sp. J-030]MCJ2072410.1 hypothetical protein [Methylobacterium sp. J-030]